MIPEISRRCLACGAAVRARASFCPYCGKKLEFANAPSAAEETTNSTEDFDVAKTWANFSASTQTPSDNTNLALTKELNEDGQRTAIYTPRDEMPISSSLAETMSPVPAAAQKAKEDFSTAIAETAPLPPLAPAENPNLNSVINEPVSAGSGAPEQQVLSVASSSAEPTHWEESTDRPEGRRKVVASTEKHRERSSRPHAEKLRDRSAALIEEASDDPGLRFVLIAVLLFIVFLVFLVFSQIIG
jgi:hypothetical protein